MIILTFFMIIFVIDNSSTDTSIIVENEGLSVPFKPNVNYVITSNFGTRIDPVYYTKRFHSGIDLAAPQGTEIVSSANGIVVEVGYSSGGLGNYVYIKHDIKGTIYYTAYGHMLDNSIIVREGQPIKAKEKIGIIGSTGKSTGIHLHFSVMTPNLRFDDNNLKNPRYIIDNDLKKKQ